MQRHARASGHPVATDLGYPSSRGGILDCPVEPGNDKPEKEET
jgi:hypothetical protein